MFLLDYSVRLLLTIAERYLQTLSWITYLHQIFLQMIVISPTLVLGAGADLKYRTGSLVLNYIYYNIKYIIICVKIKLLV